LSKCVYSQWSNIDACNPYAAIVQVKDLNNCCFFLNPHRLCKKFQLELLPWQWCRRRNFVLRVCAENSFLQLLQLKHDVFIWRWWINHLMHMRSIMSMDVKVKSSGEVTNENHRVFMKHNLRNVLIKDISLKKNQFYF